jgi:hypothetical protein
MPSSRVDVKNWTTDENLKYIDDGNTRCYISLFGNSAISCVLKK